MTIEIIECEEFSEVNLRLAALMRNGELLVDPRIATKGYLTASFKSGQVLLRTTKFVGLIPLTPDISIRVKPRASISNLSLMLARSQKAPTAISGFTRGYTSGFVRSDNVEKLFGLSLIQQGVAIAARGLIKRYERPETKVPWRGRFMASETVRRHASKGIRFRHEFDQSVLTDRTLDNFAINEALKLIADWYKRNERNSPLRKEAAHALLGFSSMPDWRSGRKELVRQLANLLASHANIRADYADALWSAYAVLDSAIPDVDKDGVRRLDSIILDVSEIFEAYIRRELADRLGREGYKVYDGWKRPHPFFADTGTYSVHPDIIIQRDGLTLAILDAKYKPDISEQDRYEVLSFMDVMKVDIGGFVCPGRDNEISRTLGTTASGKRLHMFRFDLAAENPFDEVEKFVENIRRMICGRQDLV